MTRDDVAAAVAILHATHTVDLAPEVARVADWLARMPAQEAVGWSVDELMGQAAARQAYSEGPRRDVLQSEAGYMARVAAWLVEIKE